MWRRCFFWDGAICENLQWYRYTVILSLSLSIYIVLHRYLIFGEYEDESKVLVGQLKSFCFFEFWRNQGFPVNDLWLELDGGSGNPKDGIRLSTDSSWLSKVWYPKLENNEFHLPNFPEFYSFKKKLPPQKKASWTKKSHQHNTHIFFWCWKKQVPKISGSMWLQIPSLWITWRNLCKSSKKWVVCCDQDGWTTNQPMGSTRVSMAGVSVAKPSSFSIPGEGLDKCPQMKGGRIFLLQKKHGSRFSFLSGATDSD